MQDSKPRPRTINVYAERLGYLARHLEGKGVDIEDVRKQDIQDYLLALIRVASEETVNGRIQAMQRFWNYLEQEGIWKKPNPMHRVKRIKIEKKLKEVVSEDDISKVISVVNKNSFIGFRNVTMLLWFFDTMIRRNELITLTLENVDLKSGIIKVYGKGRKSREVAMGAKMVKTMHFYLNRWRQDIPGDLVFCTHDGKTLDKDNVRHIIFRMGKKAGIHLHPHLLRHSAATWFIRHGGSPALLQRIMGHASPVVTAGYTHLNSQDIVDTYQRLSPVNSIRM